MSESKDALDDLGRMRQEQRAAKIKTVERRSLNGASTREVTRETGLAVNTVIRYRREAGLKFVGSNRSGRYERDE